MRCSRAAFAARANRPVVGSSLLLPRARVQNSKERSSLDIARSLFRRSVGFYSQATTVVRLCLVRLRSPALRVVLRGAPKQLPLAARSGLRVRNGGTQEHVSRV